MTEIIIPEHGGLAFNASTFPWGTWFVYLNSLHYVVAPWREDGKVMVVDTSDNMCKDYSANEEKLYYPVATIKVTLV